MPRNHDYAASLDALRRHTGVVIPVYFAPQSDLELGRALLEETVAACAGEAAAPGAVCLSVDGDGPGTAMARQLAQRHNATLHVGEVNRGKLGAALHGMQALLKNPELDYLAIVDQDGDHFANELLNFVRAARHVQRAAKTDQVMALGRRISRSRPMGFLRGELEELADRLLLDALHYHAATTGKPLDLRFATTLEEYPDFHSGYKLFTRANAERVFSGEFWCEGLNADDAHRHAVESVLTVESILHGAVLTVINRTTIDEQPLSTFGLFNRQRMVADKIIWPCKRLNVPPAFVAQWLDNHLPRIQLLTLAPQGKEELLGVRRLVREAFGLPDDHADAVVRPPFI